MTQTVGFMRLLPMSDTPSSPLSHRSRNTIFNAPLHAMGWGWGLAIRVTLIRVPHPFHFVADQAGFFHTEN